MPQFELAYELLKKDLCEPRTLLLQVADYISDHYTFPAAQLLEFITTKLPTLEDYEVDLTFSPQFTPSEHDRLNYIPILGENAFSSDEVTALRKRLLEENLQTGFIAPETTDVVAAPLHEVFIDRFVGLLKLDLPLPEGIHRLILSTVPEASQNEVNLFAREDVWNKADRLPILEGFLQAFKASNNFSTPKFSFLTNFVRTYRPNGLMDIERQLESLIKSCESDMENVDARGFHDDYLKALNADNQLAQPNASGVWTHYQYMMDMSNALKQDYTTIATAAPELWKQALMPAAV